MLAAVDNPLPFPCHDDLPEVAAALDRARHAWEHDDGSEALQWLKRAAREAAEHDWFDRALELSKVAADLATTLDDLEETFDGVPQRRSAVVPSGRKRPDERVPLPPPLPTIEASLAEEEPLPLARRAPANLTSLFDDDDDEPTAVRHLRIPELDEEPMPISLTASRVAVFVNRERGTLEVQPLASDEPPPSGAPLAMLVAPSAHDAERLAALLRQLVPR